MENLCGLCNKAEQVTEEAVLYSQYSLQNPDFKSDMLNEMGR